MLFARRIGRKNRKTKLFHQRIAGQFLRASVGVVYAGLLGTPAQAVVTSDLSGSHLVAPGEEAFGVNADGVVMIGGLNGAGEPVATCTGALITDRHIVSAAHCFDTDGNGDVDPLLFVFPHEAIFELADGLVAIEYSLDSIQFPDSWVSSRGDLAILTLAEDAPPGVPRYPLYGGSDEVGSPFVLVGYGNPGYGPTGEDEFGDVRPTKRAGLNRYEAVRNDDPEVDFLAYDFDSGQPENNALEVAGFASDLGFGADEVLSASGDSGGPSFIGGSIAAITAFGSRIPEADVTDELDFSWGEAGFDLRISQYRQFILDATDDQAVFVPEPSSLALITSLMVVVSGQRRPRRRQRRNGHLD
jgi:hypothetical protein